MLNLFFTKVIIMELLAAYDKMHFNVSLVCKSDAVAYEIIKDLHVPLFIAEDILVYKRFAGVKLKQ